MNLRIPLLLLCFTARLAAQSAASAQTAAPAGQTAILRYIHSGWDSLSRSQTDCATLVDPKVKSAPVLYLPYGMAVPKPIAALAGHCQVDVRTLPRPIKKFADFDPKTLPAPGLLYLPSPYVVPGGRFNEMYGWDSYFIVLGLVHDHRLDLAFNMLDNFFFEVEHYGGVLNANRTYYLTRSQPPLLSAMIAAVHAADPDRDSPEGLQWLRHANAVALKDHALWTAPAHLAGDTGLARYHDAGAGPVPEMADDSTYYPDVIRWLLAHPAEADAQDPPYLLPAPPHPTPAETAALATDSCDLLEPVCAAAHVTVRGKDYRLSASFFHGDRAMRESGFDTTFRFGPFSGSTEDYAPVCLNSLLFRYERDLGDFAAALHDGTQSKAWHARAALRRAAIDKYLWDPAAGLYYDYAAQQRSTYPYVATFYPLWAGAASDAQAAAVAAHTRDFLKPGGLATSTNASGVQWDLPYGWAPTNWFAIDGLERTGHTAEALPAARAFLATVERNFDRDGTLREKYNVADGSADIAVAAGYKANVVGFGWTNAVYLLLEDLLQAK